MTDRPPRGLALDPEIDASALGISCFSLDRPYTTAATLPLVPWDALRLLEPVDPWPGLHVEWDDDGTRVSTVLAPRGDPERFGADVERVVEETELRRPGVTKRGWLDAPDVPWELVKNLPTDVPAPPPGGAYRSTDAFRVEAVRAHRPPLTPFGSFLHWFSSREGFEFRDQPVEVAVTGEHVYARRRDGTAHRVPLSTLRAALRVWHGDTTYVFGRRTNLLLAAIPDCPVARLLDASLPHTSRGA